MGWRTRFKQPGTVIPAKAGTLCGAALQPTWIPAFAGMTVEIGLLLANK